MKLYMVRHGQSETNLSGCFTGWAQVSLTEKGLEDAKLAGEYLKDKTFDRIYASDLKRAIQTAQAAIPGCNPILTPQLREISVGRLELCSVAECEKKYGPRFMVTPQGYDLSPYGGENHQMLRERVSAFMAELEHESDEQEPAFREAYDGQRIRTVQGDAFLQAGREGKTTDPDRQILSVKQALLRLRKSKERTAAESGCPKVTYEDRNSGFRMEYRLLP